MQVPTSPITMVDRSGRSHKFLLDFGARRRVLRRLRTQQIALENVDLAGSLELHYLTIWESRLTATKLDEDGYLSQFTDRDIAKVSGALWDAYRAENTDPTNGEPSEAAFQPNPKTTENADGSSQDG